VIEEQTFDLKEIISDRIVRPHTAPVNFVPSPGNSCRASTAKLASRRDPG
jgi:hypothetical protein